ncbi:glycoside hydrolase family 30 protein [bacterium]|nr:glycoside hydrolase family 30 protein [bacterium]
MRNILLIILLGIFKCACAQSQTAKLVTTTENKAWTQQAEINPSNGSATTDVIVDVTKTQQIIQGFGACFNELGWTSLNTLKSEEREAIMKELFSPGVGANFTVCRMPVAANDFSLNWYSYNETEGDFDMTKFSIDNDKNTLIPFIKNAQKYLAGLEIWASPWSPPSWMKYNKHYASRSSVKMREMIEKRMQAQNADPTKPRPAMSSMMNSMMNPKYANDLPADKEGKEGTNMFIQDEKYLNAYALYFSKFIDAYQNEGIKISAVMPQNEFNSAQVFPSCCWTAAGLANFIGSYLGPAMEKKNVEVLFGTMERPNEALVDTILTDPKSSKYVKGVGFQWAGKDALPGINKRYPNLKFYQSEQECGDGKNDWKGVLHSWDLMKHYLNNGVSVYEYWNTSLIKGGISRWGWAQNSLVVVDADAKTYNYSNEYYLLKHVSHFVQSGAKKLDAGGEYKDVLAFLNPDKSIVVVVANQEQTEKTINIKIKDKVYSPKLAPNSFSTLVIN